MPKSVEIDIEQYIIRGESTSYILERAQISEGHVRRLKRNFRDYGSVRAPQLKRGRSRLMDETLDNALLEYLLDRPDAYAEELAFFLYDDFDGFEISEQGIALCCFNKFSEIKSHFPRNLINMTTIKALVFYH